MKLKRIISAGIIAAMLLPSTVFASDDVATRGYVADYLAEKAAFYNPGVQKTDIIKGYEDGQLHEEKGVTRAEALVMLKRAFGELPELKGDNKRSAFPAESFSDIPEWAKTELDEIFNAGIVAGTEPGIFSPDEPVTKEQLELFCKRIYAIFGTNEKDDFYATINKDTLDAMEIKPGRGINGTLYELDDESNDRIREIINDIAARNDLGKGSPEQEISDLYKNIMDKESRAKIGLTPIQPYLDEIDDIKNLDELNKFQEKAAYELYEMLLAGFSLQIDSKDSTKYILSFDTVYPNMTKDFYESGTEQQYNSYIKYIKSIIMAGGENEETAENDAKTFYNFEKRLSKATLEPQDYSDVDKTYNIFTYDELAEKAGNMDLDMLFKCSSFKKEDKIMVTDTGLLDEFAAGYTEENLDELKVVIRVNLLASLGAILSDEIQKAGETFNQEYLGISGSYSDEEKAALAVQNIMPEYVGRIYAEKYFDEKSKADVIKMIKDIISVYEKRIDNLTWMTDATKQMAKDKLNNITIKVGYPDKWDTYLDNAEIKPVSEGGSYFENILAISKAADEYITSLQGTEVDKTKWAMYPFEVNACYVLTANDITFPAGILQAPLYDVDASYEENLGGIGYIIAHEITHAFDNNGAKYDKNGNAADWWTAEDYDAFSKLCEEMIDFYDGQEAIPGVSVNGTLTLSENIADQGAAACITEIVSGLENPNYKALYTSLAKAWANTASREYAAYMTQIDVHGPGKLRVNRVVVSNDEFFKAFDITEKDGMWVAPENRVKIW